MNLGVLMIRFHHVLGEILGADATERVWDLAGGQTALARGVRGGSTVLAFSPDGQSVATDGVDDRGNPQPIVWDVRTGVARLRFAAPRRSSLAFTTDGSQLVVAGGGGVTIWDARTGVEQWRFPPQGEIAVTGVALSPGGDYLACGFADRATRVWDLRTGAPTQELRGHPEPVTHLAFSGDGQRVVGGDAGAAAPPRGGVVKVWDARTGREAAALNASKQVAGLAVNADGSQLAAGNKDSTIGLWDVQTGREIRTLKGHTRSVGKLCFSPDGKQLVSCGDDGVVSIWDVALGQQVIRLRCSASNPPEYLAARQAIQIAVAKR